MEKSLLPSLPSAVKGEKPIALTEGLLPGDLLHLLADVAGHHQGDILQPAGQCLYLDADGQPYALRIYVRPSATAHVAFTDRTAVRFPEAGQQERLFGNERLLLLTEIDLTDHAHELALERPTPTPAVAPPAAAPTGGVVRPLYPTTRRAAPGKDGRHAA